MAQVDLEQLSKRFPDGTVAVDEVSLVVADREFLVLVGPSGCGKSTTLRLIAGLETGTSGTIRIDGREVHRVSGSNQRTKRSELTNVAPKDRDIAMVFQNYALYPHMSVCNNLSFGLTLRYGGGYVARVLRRIFRPREAARLAGLRSGIDQQVRLTAARLGIEKLLNRKPHQLSGGERQRVALGRAIVRNPAAFLFDEPLSNLDAKLRGQMRVELKRLHKELGATVIYVTHDQIEAMTLGDRVAVMNEGKIQQVGSPLQVYGEPENLFVAQFIGSVPVNLRQGTVNLKNETVDCGPLKLRLDGSGIATQQLTEFIGDTNSELIAGFRCENVKVIDEAGADNELALTVTAIDRLGENALVYLSEMKYGESTESQSEQRNEERSKEEQRNKEQKNNVISKRALSAPITARVEANTVLKPGDRVQIEIDAKNVMWFDPATGRNLLKDKK